MGFKALCDIGIAQFMNHPLEFFIILAQHSDIRIIIPWNKAFVPDSAKGPSAGQPVSNVVLFTQCIYILQHFQQYELYIPYGNAGTIFSCL